LAGAALLGLSVAGMSPVCPHSPPGALAAVMAPETIVQEVYEVVDQHFLDAREGGYSRERWSQLRDEGLQRLEKEKAKRGGDKEGDDRESDEARRIAKQMLKKGIPGGDPYTRLLLPKEFERLAKYDASGVGMNLGTSSEFKSRVDASELAFPEKGSETAEAEDPFVVLGVVINSPAEIAGIHQGDRLLSIGGKAPKGITPLQAAQLIKEDAEGGSEVRLTIQRRSDGRVMDVVVQKPAPAPKDKSPQNQLLRWASGIRDVSTPVEYKMRETSDGRREGYVYLREFNAKAPLDVKRALISLDEQGADYFVLDLRDNLGGLVPAGVEVSRLFLGSEAPIVYTMTKDGNLQDRAPHPTDYQPPLTDKPLALLVNKGTASASEIVAGALKDNCRAALVGDTTFGKGLIQSVYELSDGSGLIVTVGKYVTPAHLDIDRHGISTSFKTIPSLAELQEYERACKIK